MSDSRSDAGRRALRRASLAEELTLCARALRDTLAGAHLDAALADVLAPGNPTVAVVEEAGDLDGSAGAAAAGSGPAHASARAVRDMAYAAMRQLGRLRFLAQRLNARRPPPLLGALQLAALSQLLDGRRPAATIIDQAVAAARRLPEPAGNRFGAGFMNATLRRFERERPALLAESEAEPEAVYNHPAWWIDRVRGIWPHGWQQLLVDSMSHAPLSLRVNRRFGWSIGEAGRQLAAAGLPHRRVGSEALALERAVGVSKIPGFAEGAFTVQDAGAQLAAPLLHPAAGERILDACAAPGGKTTHLLQLADCQVLAIDRDPGRAARIADNLRREGLPLHDAWPPPAWGAVVRTADAMRPAHWWDGEPFDRILLDAPCSASGIVRRHPDIPWQRRRGDLTTMAAQQRLLLQALWPLLRPGGTLLYVTCSIFPEEGEEAIAAFCSHQAGCMREPVSTSWPDGQPIPPQLLPTSTDVREHDGFFYALLSKQS